MTERSPLETMPVPDTGLDLAAPAAHEQRRGHRSMWQRTKRALAGAAMTGMLVSSLPGDTEVTLPYAAPEMIITEENGVCPPNAKFLLPSIGGIGWRSNSLYYSYRTGEILGDAFDECEVALDPGTNYDTIGNTRALHEIREKTGLHTIVMFMHSFGGVAGIDIIKAYRELYPDDDVKFAAVLFAAPGTTDDVKGKEWALLHLASSVRLTQEAMWGAYWVGSILQGHPPLDKQVLHDVGVNAGDSPPTLMYDEANRLSEGISDPEDNSSDESKNEEIPLYYIADNRDQVVDVPRAIETIENRLGRKFTTVASVILSSDQLGYHATLWREEAREDYRLVVNGVILPDILKRLGITAPIRPTADSNVPSVATAPSNAGPAVKTVYSR